MKKYTLLILCVFSELAMAQVIAPKNLSADQRYAYCVYVAHIYDISSKLRDVGYTPKTTWDSTISQLNDMNIPIDVRKKSSTKFFLILAFKMQEGTRLKSKCMICASMAQKNMTP